MQKITFFSCGVSCFLCMTSPLWAMDQKPLTEQYEPKDFVVLIDRLEKILQQQQDYARSQVVENELPLSSLHQRIIPKDIVITMTLPEFLELQKKSGQAQVVVSDDSRVPGQEFEQGIDSLKNGIQALKDGKPYNAWHYVSSGGGIIASLSSLAGVIITLVILLK